MKNLNKFLLSLLIVAGIFVGCDTKTELNAPSAPATGAANFSKFVSIGNSLTAGLQSNALYESSQVNSFGALIAKQVQTPYEQPLISDPGFGGRMEVVSLSPFVSTVNTTPGQPLNANYGAAYNNMGIPGALLPDVLLATSSETSLSGNPIFDLILRGQGTALQQALSLNPTFMTVWIGNNDILGHAAYGGALPYTPTPVFNQLYAQLMGALAQAGVKAAVANIPDITTIPFFTTVGPGLGFALKELQQQNPQVQGLVFELSTGNPPIGLATQDDLITLQHLIPLSAAFATDYLGDQTGKYYSDNGIPVPPYVDTNYPFGLTPQNPWPNRLILDKQEVINSLNVINSYNATIWRETRKYGFALVDVNRELRDIRQNGLSVDGLQFTSAYGTGGLFSLDGVHPTTRGYGIIANKFIYTINNHYGAQIPGINISTLPASLEISGANLGKYGIPKVPKDILDIFYY